MRLAKQDALLDLFGQVQDPLRLLEQHQAVLGGDRAARVAGEQRRLELVLEQSDLAAEGGLRDVQFDGGLLETFVPRYRHEVAELTQFHSLTYPRGREPGRTRSEESRGGKEGVSTCRLRR